MCDLSFLIFACSSCFLGLFGSERSALSWVLVLFLPVRTHLSPLSRGSGRKTGIFLNYLTRTETDWTFNILAFLYFLLCCSKPPQTGILISSPVGRRPSEETVNSGRSRFPHPEEEAQIALTQTVLGSGRKGLSSGLYQICRILGASARDAPPSRRLLLWQQLCGHTFSLDCHREATVFSSSSTFIMFLFWFL